MENKAAITVLAQNGKSFYFAGLFLPRTTLNNISELYHFCRYVDDCADELEPAQAKIEIQNIMYTLLTLESPQTHLVNTIRRLESFGIKRYHLIDLVRGAEIDLDEEVIFTEEDLDKYCYHVAGVVGLMMNPLMKVTDVAADPYAISLGKGMQLTNICRDILEDAQNNRFYIPQKDLIEKNINHSQLGVQGPTPEAVKILVKKYLDKAEHHYLTAYQGLSFIPLNCRFVILLAGEVYRHIGLKIAKNNYEVLQQRTYLNFFEKIVVLFKTLPLILKPSFWKYQNSSNTIRRNYDLS